MNASKYLKIALTLCIFALYDVHYINAFSIDKFNIDIYLENLSIYCITQDNNGVTWFGTNNGLLYLENSPNLRLKTYHNDLLQTEPIWNFSIDLDQKLWCITEQNGLFYYSQGEKEWKKPRFRTPITELLIEPFLHVDANNNIWFGSNTKLFCYSRNRETVYKVSVENDIEISSIIDAGNDLFLVLEYNGSRLFLMKNDIIHQGSYAESKLTIQETLYKNKWRHGWRMIQSMHNLDDIFIASEKALFKYNWNNESLDIYKEYANSITYQIYIDNEKRVWLANKNDVKCINDNYNYETNVFSNDDGLSEGDYYYVFQDKDNDHWIGTANGLNRISKKEHRFLQKEKLEKSMIHKLHADRSVPKKIIIENRNIYQGKLIDNQPLIDIKTFSLKNKKKEKIFSGWISYKIKAEPEIEGKKFYTQFMDLKSRHGLLSLKKINLNFTI